MKFASSFVGATAAALFSVRAAAEGLSISSDADIKATAKTVAGQLLQYYKGDEPGEVPGVLPGPPPAGDYYWWTASAAWASLVDYWHFTGDASHNALVMRALLAQAGPDADYMPLNQSATMGNDDQGFWGIAALTAAERRFPAPPRDQPQWLALAQAVFGRLAARWDDKTCGGGLRWQISFVNNGWDYKNAVSAGVLLNLGARLNRYTGNGTYGDWAGKVWDWAAEVGFIQDDGAIYDGARPSGNCSEIAKFEFSYNSGLFVLGAAAMYNTTTDAKWKDRLDSVLAHSLRVFFKDGAAYEAACESDDRCTSDMTFFKGVFVQMLAAAAQVAPHTADTILPVLRKSAAAAVRSCSDDGVCGLDWTAGEFDGEASAGAECNVLSSVAPLLAKAGDAPYTAKTGGTSTGGGSSSSGGGGSGGGGDGGNSTGNGNENTKGDKNGNGGGDNKKGAAGKTTASITLALVMTCAAVALL